MNTTTRLGLMLSGLYILVAVYLVATQGLMGESFVSLILGMPWTFLLAIVEFGGVGDNMASLLLVASMALNALILYWIGNLLGRLISRS